MIAHEIVIVREKKHAVADPVGACWLTSKGGGEPPGPPWIRICHVLTNVTVQLLIMIMNIFEDQMVLNDDLSIPSFKEWNLYTYKSYETIKEHLFFGSMGQRSRSPLFVSGWYLSFPYLIGLKLTPIK